MCIISSEKVPGHIKTIKVAKITVFWDVAP
jgi:hypothetical protein